jgi:4'-phosphopantetheinyl transferase
MSDFEGPRPPADLSLADTDVHVWLVRLDQPSARAMFRPVLSEDEKTRADRFYTEELRLRFTVARGVLRHLLGSYLRARPEAIVFDYGARGKPSLSGKSEGPGIRFNISHSKGLALMAFTLGRELGVDIEYINTEFETESIAGNYFSPTEVEALFALPREARIEAFFNCWTRKEAYIKATGEGLSCPLDAFDVTLTPGEPAALLATRVESQEAANWSMRSLDPGEGFKGALIVEGHDWELNCWRWEAAGS